MYTWANIQPDYVNDAGETGKNYLTYTSGLDSLFSTLYAADLKSLIAAADSIISQEDSYTPASFEIFRSSLENAENVISATPYTVARIDDADEDLKFSITQLLLKSTEATSASPTTSSALEETVEPALEDLAVSTNNPETSDADPFTLQTLLLVMTFSGITYFVRSRTRIV